MPSSDAGDFRTVGPVLATVVDSDEEIARLERQIDAGGVDYIVTVAALKSGLLKTMPLETPLPVARRMLLEGARAIDEIIGKEDR